LTHDYVDFIANHCTHCEVQAQELYMLLHKLFCLEVLNIYPEFVLIGICIKYPVDQQYS